MNSRLQQFLEIENLTPARLADILGVQRSGLSHILSGRNKPGYDFINKLLLKFPSINAEWLITGKGKPYKDFNDIQSSAKKNHSKDGYLEDREILQNNKTSNHFTPNSSKNNNDSEAILNNDDLFSISLDNEQNSISIQQSNNEEHNLKNTPSELAENEIKAGELKVVHKKRCVKRVIIFYNDGSFEEMFPHHL